MRADPGRGGVVQQLSLLLLRVRAAGTVAWTGLGWMDRQMMSDVLLQIRKLHRLFERRWRSSVLRGK